MELFETKEFCLGLKLRENSWLKNDWPNFSRKTVSRAESQMWDRPEHGKYFFASLVIRKHEMRHAIRCTTPEIFKNAALFPWLDLQSTLIRHRL